MMLRKMDVDATSMGSSVKPMLVVKISDYRNDLNKLKTELKRLLSAKKARGNNTISQASMIVVDSSTSFPAIMDYRTNGKGIQEDDIIQLRRTCRMSGVKVFIDTGNSRDSICRASVDFTLNTCGRVASHSTFVQIDGEDAREFIAGLADNIGLQSLRAARMVAAAVAATTRVLEAIRISCAGYPRKRSFEMFLMGKYALCLNRDK